MLGPYLTENATWRRTGGLDAYNEPLPTSDTAIKCRAEWKIRTVRDVNGVEAVSSGSLLVRERPSLSDRYAIGAATYAIISVVELKQFSSLLGYKVYLQ